MEIKVTKCMDCPFLKSYYDNMDEINYECNLLIREYNEVSWVFYDIEIDNKNNVNSKNKKTLDNCPLLKENIIVSYGN